MPSDRFFCAQALEEGKRALLKDEELHHLVHVMRIEKDEEIELVNGKGELALAQVEKISAQAAELKILSVVRASPPVKKIILAQALPRLSRLEYILEKGTELNAAEFWLFPGVLSEKEALNAHQQKRMEQIILNALKQCGRLYLPLFKVMPLLKKWEKPSGALLFGDLGKNAKPVEEMMCTENTQILFIGPEKGFSAEEVVQLEQWQAHGVRLHPNTLRVDTAAIVGLALLYAGGKSTAPAQRSLAP